MSTQNLAPPSTAFYGYSSPMAGVRSEYTGNEIILELDQSAMLIIASTLYG